MGQSLGKKGKKSLLLLFDPVVMNEGEELVEIDSASMMEAIFERVLLLLCHHFSDVTKNIVNLLLLLAMQNHSVHPEEGLLTVIHSVRLDR